jgi:hypothetical protein
VGVLIGAGALVVIAMGAYGVRKLAAWWRAR